MFNELPYFLLEEVAIVKKGVLTEERIGDVRICSHHLGLREIRQL